MDVVCSDSIFVSQSGFIVLVVHLEGFFQSP